MSTHAQGRGEQVSASALAILGAQGPMSRTAMARQLAVSPATITQVTRDLLDRGLIVELDTTPSRGGRPARLIGLSSTSTGAIGAKVTADHVAVVSVGLDGNIRSQTVFDFDPARPDALVTLGHRLRDVLAAEPASVLGVGVCLPGAVDSQASGVVNAPTLGWTSVNVGSMLRGALGVPVLVENDVNALAIAESLYGTARGHRSALIVTIGRGIGSGLIVDGALYRGSGGGAGEIGHMPVAESGPVCECGNTGCLESVIGESALRERAIAHGVVPDGAALLDVVRLADAGDESARTIFRDAGTLLGRTLAGFVQLIDPGTVILLGEGINAWSHWERGFEPAFRAHLLPARRSIPFTVEPWADDKWALGAASIVLATPFDAAGASGDQGRLVVERLQSEPDDATSSTVSPTV